MTAFDGAVLVRDATVVAGRHLTEMDDERREAPGQVFGIRQSQITEGGREAVAAMLPRNAAEQAQRILQAAGQGRVALATQHDLIPTARETDSWKGGQCIENTPFFAI